MLVAWSRCYWRRSVCRLPVLVLLSMFSYTCAKKSTYSRQHTLLSPLCFCFSNLSFCLRAERARVRSMGSCYIETFATLFRLSVKDGGISVGACWVCWHEGDL